MATLRCDICGDDFDALTGGGSWGTKLVCHPCEDRTFGSSTAALAAITTVLEHAGVEDPPALANEVYTAILLSRNLVVSFDEELKRNEAFRAEIADLRRELGR